MNHPSQSGSGSVGGRCRVRLDNNSRNDENGVMQLLNIPLIHLPLRPSSLKLLQQAGFVTSREVVQAKQEANGLVSFAAELSMTVSQAASIYREVVETSSSSSSSSRHDENNDNNNNNRPTLQQQQQQHQQRNNKRPLVTLSSSSAACSASTSALSLLQNHGGGGGAAMSSVVANLSNNNSCGVEAIVTFCRPVDQLLGGGIALQELTEISGKPGTGKTQFGMQLAVDARLPLPVGGVAGECIYVDAEGSFAPERCYTLARALVQHVQAGQKKRQQRQQPAAPANIVSMPSWFTPESILQGIHVFRVHDVAAQTATLMGAIPQLLQERQAAGSPVRLIVVDSIAFHYRAAAAAVYSSTTTTTGNNNSSSDFMDRTRQLTRVASHLAELAMTFNVAVVALNQMTTKVVATAAAINTTMDRHEVVPALGEAWAHAVTTRLLLVNHDEAAPGATASDDSYETTTAASTAGGGGLNGNKTVLRRRSCNLIKSPRLAPGRAFFQVCESGIRGLEFENRRHDDEQQQQQQHNHHQTGNNNNNTRNAPYNQSQHASKRQGP